MTERPDPSRRRLEMLDTLARLLLGFGTFALSAAIGFATIYYNRQAIHDNRQAAQLQIQNQIDALELQEATTAAQILVEHLPTIVDGPARERELTLAILELVSPRVVEEIGERLLKSAESSEEVERAQEIIANSQNEARKQSVIGHIENARKFLDFGASPAAAREYLKAYEALPPELRKRVSEQAEEAMDLYQAGEFSRAAEEFAQAFREGAVIAQLTTNGDGTGGRR